MERFDVFTLFYFAIYPYLMENGTVTTQFDYPILLPYVEYNISFFLIETNGVTCEWWKYEIKLPFHVLPSINSPPVKLKKEGKSETAETSQAVFRLPYQQFSSPSLHCASELLHPFEVHRAGTKSTICFENPPARRSPPSLRRPPCLRSPSSLRGPPSVRSLRNIVKANKITTHK